MGEVLCLGVSHHPGFAYPDESMADILRRHLMNPRIPIEAKDPSNWPEQMRKEFGLEGENATAEAAEHRRRVIGAYRQVREQLDAFQPDFVLIFGDDQYENFREDLVPPFCVYIMDQFETRPFSRRAGWAMGDPKNIWGEPDDKTFVVKGHPQAAKYLTRRLLEAGYAVPYAYTMRHHQGLAHAFMNTVYYLDYDRKGFDYPIIPFHVNCYGSSIIRNRGGDSLDKDQKQPDPPAPSPKLCFEMGAAVGRVLRDSPWKAAVIGSSSWSHAFLTEKNHFLYPDVEADRQRYEELKNGRQAVWKELSIEQIEQSGQHEVLNWVCMAGALTELGLQPEIIDFTESYIFNSSKCTMIARPATGDGALAAAGSERGVTV